MNRMGLVAAGIALLLAVGAAAVFMAWDPGQERAAPAGSTTEPAQPAASPASQASSAQATQPTQTAPAPAEPSQGEAPASSSAQQAAAPSEPAPSEPAASEAVPQAAAASDDEVTELQPIEPAAEALADAGAGDQTGSATPAAEDVGTAQGETETVARAEDSAPAQGTAADGATAGSEAPGSATPQAALPPATEEVAEPLAGSSEGQGQGQEQGQAQAQGQAQGQAGGEETPRATRAAAPPTPPSFDIVRIERSGESVIAGRADPGSVVVVVLDGEEIGRVTADRRGQWVFLPEAPLAPGSHELGLRAEGGSGGAVESENIVVAVVPKPEPKLEPEQAEQPAAVAGRQDQTAEPPAQPVEPGGGTSAQPADEEETIIAAIPQPAEIAESVPEARASAQPLQQGAPQLADEPAGPVDGQATAVSGEASAPASASSKDTAQPVAPVIPATTATAEPTPADRTGDDGAADQAGESVIAAIPDKAAADQGATAADREPKVEAPAASQGGGKTSDTTRTSDTSAVAATADTTDSEAGPQQPLAVLLPRSGSGNVKILQQPDEKGVGDQELVLRSVNYDAQGQITISGEAKAGALIIVYMDDEAIGKGVVGSAGRWRFTPGRAVVPGLHRLRVDQHDEGGKVVARVETPFSRAAVLTDLPGDRFVVVQPGNSLWRIARSAYGDGIRYSVIYGSNRRQIRDPDLIYPGQIFLVPEVN